MFEHLRDLWGYLTDRPPRSFPHRLPRLHNALHGTLHDKLHDCIA